MPIKSTPANAAVEQEANKPVQVFRARGVRASLFANHVQNDGREIVFHKVALARVYREGDAFKTTYSLGRDDLPVAQFLLQKAWQFILEAEAHRDIGEPSN
jgi:hypothetical protein